MGKVLNFIKDKIYYIMALTILVIVIIIAISSCSMKASSYSSIEYNMVNAAKNYYSTRKERLPNEDGNSVMVTISTLVDAELLNEVYDPKDENVRCSGNVVVKKVEDDYVYTPFLTCGKNYESRSLKDVIINSGVDEYGNGIYLIDNEYVYRGDDVNNYVLFANKLWRIVLVDTNGDIEIVLNEPVDDEFAWETSFNVEKQDSVGVTTNYFNSDIRKSLIEYYNNEFTKEDKAKIVSKNLCIGSLGKYEDFNRQKECNKIQENEKIGLLRVSDYQRASLDSTCINRRDGQCRNHNYLASNADIDSWLLNSVEDNTYQMFVGYSLAIKEAASYEKINPVLYLSKDVITTQGDGEKDNPFVIK